MNIIKTCMPTKFTTEFLKTYEKVIEWNLTYPTLNYPNPDLMRFIGILLCTK